MSSVRTPRAARGVAFVALAALVAACSSSGSSSSSATAGATTTATQSNAATTSVAPSTTGSQVDGSGNAPATRAPTGHEVDQFAWRGPATGAPFVIGMVNTEGTPGLDFPGMRTDTDAAVAYLNAHGGMGGRVVKMEHCATVGSPESSQASAQQLIGKKVDLVMLGLDIFPAYDTYKAAGIPVIGALPILPGDYTASALFVSGGNLTTMAAMVVLAVQKYHAKSAGIISADNAGSNGSEATLVASLKKQGISAVSIKGGDNETDAGFEGLMRQATEKNPDVIFSLYADSGCIGAMRARVSLGITAPAITTPICAGASVLSAVGDDALGWSFAGAGSSTGSPASNEFSAIVKSAHGNDGANSIGIGALGIDTVMTLARVANHIVDSKGDISGANIYRTFAAAKDVPIFPNDNLAACGSVKAYPSVCSFVFPIGEYVAGGTVQTVEGFDAVSVVDYLP